MLFRSYEGAHESNKSKINDDFDWEDYPNVYGFRDSTGNRFKVNKNQGTVEFKHFSGTTLLIKTDGSVVITTLTSFIVNAKDFIVNATNATINAVLTTLNSAAHITGLTTSDSDVVASGISLDHHTHGGIQGGSGSTSPPH